MEEFVVDDIFSKFTTNAVWNPYQTKVFAANFENLVGKIVDLTCPRPQNQKTIDFHRLLDLGYKVSQLGNSRTNFFHPDN